MRKENRAPVHVWEDLNPFSEKLLKGESKYYFMGEEIGFVLKKVKDKKKQEIERKIFRRQDNHFRNLSRWVILKSTNNE